jgi:hypothetical protein
MSPVMRYLVATAVTAACLRLEYEFLSGLLTPGRTCTNRVCEVEVISLLINGTLALITGYGFVIAWRIARNPVAPRPMAVESSGSSALLSGPVLIVAGLFLVLVAGFLGLLGVITWEEGEGLGFSVGMIAAGVLLLALAVAAWRLAWQRHRSKQITLPG